ncbi:hypothetical protein HS088_TW05G00017 [Tripterygium wilfordii]|uniref:Cytochrome c oxidase subunit 6a mitochondrial-like n=1 Tax=Tripterygium wilfordii TaxID=458696 RepID=A0A7J7DMI5_TRIWF|nr:hypothetical protein HS088_TW05G00017 [Tripterygium wilfordii]
MSAARSAFLRNALQGGSRTSLLPQRRFSSSAHHDDAYEAKKWERITYLGIASCTILASYILSKGHPHYDEPTVSTVVLLIVMMRALFTRENAFLTSITHEINV